MTDDAVSSKLARRATIAAVACVVVVVLAAAAVWTQRPKLVPIEVSQQTTYIITPTRADGWVDYPEAVDWMRRASLDAGGVNAAVPLLHALGRDMLPIGVDRGAILARLRITGAGDESSVLKPLQKFSGAAATPGPEPSPAAMAWLRARCRAAGRTQAPFARLLAWLTHSEAALSDLLTASQATSLYVPVARQPGAGFDRINPALLGDAADALGCRAAVRLLRGDA